MTSTTSSGGNSNPPTFPEEFLFDGTNYIMFRDQVLLAARLRGTKGYLNGTIETPNLKMTVPAPPVMEWWDKNPLHQDWQVQNAWTLALIVYNTKNPVGLEIKISDTAARAWEMLKASYGTISDLGANMAENVVRATKYSDGMDFQEHITSLCVKWNHAVKKGAKIKNNQFRAIVISSLPASWDYIVASLQSTKTSIKLIARLNVHSEHLKEHLMSGTESNSTVLLAKSPQPQNE